MHLDDLHAEHTITTILDARDGITSAAVYEWVKHRREVEHRDWSGEQVGAERVRVVLANAPPDACVIVWGIVPAFINRERRRHLDVPMGLVIQAVLDAGLTGWATAGERLITIGADA